MEASHVMRGRLVLHSEYDASQLIPAVWLSSSAMSPTGVIRPMSRVTDIGRSGRDRRK